MRKILSIPEAIEEFELYSLYNDIIESNGEDLEDQSLVSDLYDLMDEHEDEYEFWPDQDGDFSESFEKNVIEAIHSIVDENDELAFVDDGFLDDDDDVPLMDDFEDEDGTIKIDQDRPDDEEDGLFD